MGCDIHAILEVKKDNNWHNYKELNIFRNYDLFSKMVDGHVRGSEEGIAPERGLPDDSALITRIILDQDDLHTHSWLNREELLQLLTYLKDNDLKNDLYWFLTDSDEQMLNYYGFEDYRLIFAFDN